MKDDERLVAEFHQAMLDVYHAAKREAGYNATYFYRMVLDEGGLRTAQRLLTSQSVATGLTELWRKGRLDISMESVVLRERFRSLFTDTELELAAQRLRDLGYLPKTT